LTDPTVAYEDVAGVLNQYVQAMCGRSVRADVVDLPDPAAAGGCGVVTISDDEIRIRVPVAVRVFSTQAENTRFLRCVVSHQVGHAEFGTDRFRFDRPSRHFRDLRPRLAPGGLGAGATAPQLFSHLQEPPLARAIFFELEELRVEAAMERRYPGIAAELRWFGEWRDEHVGHPDEVDLQWLRRLAHLDPSEPREPALARLRAVIDQVRRPHASVEDTVEATLRVYTRIRRLGGAAGWTDDEADGTGTGPAPRPGSSRRRPGEADLRAGAGTAGPDGEDTAGNDDDTEGVAAELPVPPVARPVTVAGRPFHYPEWDFRAHSHLAGHTTVWERVGPAGPTTAYYAALREHAALIRGARARFEAIQASAAHDRMLDVDGDSLDLDALVDHAVARRAREDQASELVYVRRGALRRDVAALVLLDVSATTSEPILRRPGGVGPTAPPADRHTVLSVERAASIVMLKAADEVGDLVAMYAFSGLGRHGVEVLSVKEFGAPLDHRVASRVGGLRPQRATRMGAAIRHATARLMEQPAHRRLLFFVNDGRPFDVDYGRGDDDQRYAIADTRKALDEAGEAGVQVSCLTVQAEDPSHLPEMCGTVPYELVRHAEELPERLLAAYASLRLP
jgi:nitric oxide reductase NorD protein